MKKHYVYGLYKKNIEYYNLGIGEHLFYVGISSGDKNLYFREKNHRNQSCGYKLNIINKYDFDLNVLWSCDSRSEAEEREAFLIRWFKSQLCNILESSKDLSRARSRPRKPKEQWKKRSPESRIANRDRSLTVEYEKVLSLLDEWAKNPLESQQDFANRHGVTRSKFKDWMRMYRPEYIGLTKKFWRDLVTKYKKQLGDSAKQIDIARAMSLETGHSVESCRHKVMRYK